MQREPERVRHLIATQEGLGPERRGVLGMARTPFVLMREWWQVQRVSRVMLGRFRGIVRLQPGLERIEVYRLLVQEHVGCDGYTANRILRGAAQSFAVWPEERDLQLRDVIHYVAVTEFLHQRSRPAGMRSDVQALVNAVVPEYL